EEGPGGQHAGLGPAPVAVSRRAARSDRVLEAGRRAVGPNVGPHDRGVAGQSGHRHAVQPAPRPVDRSVVACARTGHEHRRVCPAAWTVSRSVAGDDRAGQEGRRPADRGRAADAQHGVSNAADSGGPSDRRARRARRARGRRGGGGVAETRWRAAGRPEATRRRYTRGGVEGALMIGKTIAELRPGDYAEIERHVEMEAIAEFINAVGDYNPIHSDSAYAAATSFGE